MSKFQQAPESVLGGETFRVRATQYGSSKSSKNNNQPEATYSPLPPPPLPGSSVMIVFVYLRKHCINHPTLFLTLIKRVIERKFTRIEPFGSQGSVVCAVFSSSFEGYGCAEIMSSTYFMTFIVSFKQ